MPSLTWVDGQIPAAADLNTQYRDQVVTICTSGTRPTTSTIGRGIRETDTGRDMTWTASGWVCVRHWGPWFSWTPTITQAGSTLTLAASDARYKIEGKTFTWSLFAQISTPGTTGFFEITTPAGLVFTGASFNAGSGIVGPTFLMMRPIATALLRAQAVGGAWFTTALLANSEIFLAGTAEIA